MYYAAIEDEKGKFLGFLKDKNEWVLRMYISTHHLKIIGNLFVVQIFPPRRRT